MLQGKVNLRNTASTRASLSCYTSYLHVPLQNPAQTLSVLLSERRFSPQKCTTLTMPKFKSCQELNLMPGTPRSFSRHWSPTNVFSYNCSLYKNYSDNPLPKTAN
jgi:hypothetical protein